MTRAELFLKKGFEVCLLNKVFAVIIRLHIKVQTHLMLEVTENCYHLMALWAELSQTTRHALKARFLGITPGDLKRLGNTDCTFPRVASWAINLTVIALWPWAVGVIPIPSSLFAIFVPLEFSFLISHPPIYLWGPEKPWWVVHPGCHFGNSHHRKTHLRVRFSREREIKGEGDWLVCPGWVSSSSVVLKGKTDFNCDSAPLPSSLACEACLGTEREGLWGTRQASCFRQEPHSFWEGNLFLGLHTWVFYFYSERNGTMEAQLFWW